MHILKVPSFFFTNNTGAPQGEELGQMKPLSKSSCSCLDSSSSSVGAKCHTPKIHLRSITAWERD
ncbi:hypothetical protein HanIR_Chr09g0409141 [Helianthus annuus]|nr:hypothetical protein HanIR_Chr09g0409141 [Helianthus annuus]